jgi:hypothetical protein
MDTCPTVLNDICFASAVLAATNKPVKTSATPIKMESAKFWLSAANVEIDTSFSSLNCDASSSSSTKLPR